MLNAVATAAISAVMFGATALAVSFLGRFMPFAMLYHAIIYAVFWVVYQTLPGGFAKNFNLPSNVVREKNYTGDGPLDVAYFTMVMHTTVGFGDVYPITWYARSVTMLHLFLVFMATASLLPFTLSSRALAPPNASLNM